MIEFNVFSAFLVGIAGSVHCVGMCGGIVTAMRSITPPSSSSWPYAISYNFGRIISYSIAGALAGLFGQIVAHTHSLTLNVLTVFSAVMLIGLAAYIGGWWQGLTHLERVGSVIWRKLQPLSRRFIPFKTPLAAIPYGIVWGWLPCGLVYSTLTWSLSAGDAVSGAAIMFAFGLGTLPSLFIANASVNYLIQGFKHPALRQFVAFGLLIYAIFLIYRMFGSI